MEHCMYIQGLGVPCTLAKLGIAAVPFILASSLHSCIPYMYMYMYMNACSAGDQLAHTTTIRLLYTYMYMYMYMLLLAIQVIPPAKSLRIPTCTLSSKPS